MTDASTTDGNADAAIPGAAGDAAPLESIEGAALSGSVKVIPIWQRTWPALVLFLLALCLPAGVTAAQGSAVVLFDAGTLALSVESVVVLALLISAIGKLPLSVRGIAVAVALAGTLVGLSYVVTASIWTIVLNVRGHAWPATYPGAGGLLLAVTAVLLARRALDPWSRKRRSHVQTAIVIVLCLVGITGGALIPVFKHETRKGLYSTVGLIGDGIKDFNASTDLGSSSSESDSSSGDSADSSDTTPDSLYDQYSDAQDCYENDPAATQEECDAAFG